MLEFRFRGRRVVQEPIPGSRDRFVMRGVSSIGEYEEVVADFFYAVGQLIEASKYNGLRKFLPRNISVGASILCSKSDPGKVLGVVIYASPKVLDLLPGSGYDTVPAYPMEVLADGIF